MESFLDPTQVLKELNLKEDMAVADFGSGSGSWVLPLAKIAEMGKIYAVDILEEPLSALRAKAKAAKADNIQTILADVEKGIKEIPEESLDLILMTNLLFECEDKKKILEYAKSFLKPRGRILVVDWKKEALLGPKEGRISLSELKEIAFSLDLTIEKEFAAGIYHYAIILVK